MSVEITEAYILDRLHTDLSGADPSGDGYAEIEVTDETRLKCAAVLVPLVEAEDGWHILYTRRTDRVESHKGQVSFPGGGCDAEETLAEQTALREAEEEVGIDPAGVRILGRLPNMITISGFRVTPVVGVIRWPTVFRLGEAEVERVFTIPLRWLADRRNRWEFRLPGRNGPIIAYHPYDGELLWGATARMTVDFLDVLGL
jgi:8-oxo-dGTP pyrophosphatase MutT (NUDIX family)